MSQTILYPGQRGPHITEMQQSLNALLQRLGAPPIQPQELASGQYGPSTTAGILYVQRLAMERGLTRPDGTPYSWADIDGRHGANTAHLMQMLGTPIAPEPVATALPTVEAMQAFANELSPVPPMAGIRSPFFISAEDIVPVEQRAEVLQRARMRPEDAALLDTALDQLAQNIGNQPQHARGALVLATREMYLNGYPVRFRNDTPPPSADQPAGGALNVELEPLGRVSFNRDHMSYFDRVMDNNGLSLTRRRNQGLGVSEATFTMDELRLAIAQEHGILEAVSPVADAHRVSSDFGVRRHPIWGGRREHNGIDYAPVPAGTRVPIRAAMPGEVIFAGREGGYGNVIKVRDIEGVTHVYAHLSRIDVEVGDVMQQGDHLGRMGNTGASTGVHLHYEQIGVDGNKRPPVVNAEAEPRRVSPPRMQQANTTVVTEQRTRAERQIAQAQATADNVLAGVREIASNAREVAGDAIASAQSFASDAASRIGGLFRRA